MLKKLFNINVSHFTSYVSHLTFYVSHLTSYVRNQRGNTFGQAIVGVVGAVAGILIGNPAGVYYAIAIGLGIGLTVGGILFPPDIQSQKAEPGTLQLQTSQYGIPVPVVYGSRKISGNLIWYGNFQSHEHEEDSGGKGGNQPGYTSYTYSVGLAFGICMAPAGDRKNIINVWAGKDLVDPSKYRVYDGSQVTPDSYIAGFTTRDPVWKNLCYIVFEDYDLGSSPMIPNFTYEVGILGGWNYYSQFGSYGVGNGEFDQQLGIAIDANYIYVADINNDRIQIFNLASPYSYVDQFNDSGNLSRPTDIEVDNNYLYVVDKDNDKIKIFNKTSPFAKVGEFGSTGSGNGQFDGPIGIDIDANHIYIADAWNHRIQIFDKSSPYGYVGQFGSYGTGDGQFYGPWNLAVNSNYIYVADTYNNRIQIFDINSPYNFVGKFGSYGTGNGQFKMPTDIEVNNDYIYVVDSSCHRIQIFDINSSYTYKNQFGSYGTGNGQFYYPLGLAIDNNHVYISDSYNNRVQIFNITINTAFDVLPTTISNDILTNDLYGLGLSSGYLNSAVFATTATYCTTNDLLVSLIFDSQMSVLDALQHVISHHNGFISYFDGLIAHDQLKSETPISTITTADTTKEDEYPVQISKKGGRDYNNKVTVEYTKREQEYILGTASVDDMVDIDKYGKKDVSVKLDGITKHAMASKMANLLLKKSLSNPESIIFKLGPKAIGIKPGDVHAITDSGVELSALPIRIETISESDDYRIKVAATEEVNVYDLIATGEDTTAPPSAPNLNGDPGDVVNPLSLELPALYSQALCEAIILYSKSALEPWAGASLYRAYTETGSYGKLASKTGSGITGTVSAVGTSNWKAYIDVVLDWDATLSSALSFDDLITTPGKNLLFIRTASGDKFLKYQTVELIAEKTWRLTGLIYDIVNVPKLNTYGSIIATNKAGFYSNIPHTLLLSDTDKFKTLWFKLPSFNFGGLEQDLSLLSPISQAINALCDTPLQPYNIKINTIGVTEGGSIIIPAGDIAISWMSRNRFNAGATNFSRTDTVIDDSDFQNFEIKIYNGATLLRTVTQTSKSYNYTTALQTTDGGPFNSYTVKIRQINTLVSSGQETINITTV